MEAIGACGAVAVFGLVGSRQVIVAKTGKPFHDTSNFKTYDELKEKMERVLGGSRDNRTAEQISQDVEDTFSYDSIKEFKDEKMSSKPESSDTMAYFEKLATT